MNQPKTLRLQGIKSKAHTKPNEINRRGEKKLRKINVKLTTTGDGVYNNNKKKYKSN